MPGLKPPAAPRRPSRHTSQRGVASLVVVMVLFFVLSLVAAYTNRNLIFEQRTAANQYRSTQALEAAQAGLEWAMSMLNSGRVTDTCAASAVATDPSFRQRYLAVDPVSGQINVNLQSDGVSPLMPSCVFDGTNWVCSCPADGNPVLAAPAGAGVFPAFRVRLMPAAPSRPGVVRIESNGCTRLDDACLNFPSAAVAGEGRSTLFATLALRNGLAAPPVAAVTAGRTLDVGGAALGIVNADPASTGVTVLAGGLVNIVGLRLQSHPGTPVGPTVLDSDPALAALLDPDRMFVNTFGTLPAVYRLQPAAVRPACTAGTCTANDVRTAASLNPDRVIWIDGDLDIDTGGDIGSAAEPLVLVVTGNLTFSTPANVFGLVYSRAADWVSSGAGVIRGAAVAETRLSGSATTDIVYDTAILNHLRLQTGSLILVPGSWRDFE